MYVMSSSEPGFNVHESKSRNWSASFHHYLYWWCHLKSVGLKILVPKRKMISSGNPARVPLNLKTRYHLASLAFSWQGISRQNVDYCTGQSDLSQLKGNGCYYTSEMRRSMSGIQKIHRMSLKKYHALWLEKMVNYNKPIPGVQIMAQTLQEWSFGSAHQASIHDHWVPCCEQKEYIE